MALEADIIPTENLVYNGNFSNLIENGQILLLNEPVMIYTQENIENDCAIVLDPITDENSQNLNLPEIIFDGNYFQFENLHSNNFQNDYDTHENFQYIDERQQVDDGLAVLEILCNNTNSTLDQPEFVDVNKLTEPEKFIITQENDVLSISDDDDVVFVREYKENKTETTENLIESAVKLKKIDNNIRRNPIRTVRTRSRDLSKELLFEEDFAFLDASEDEGEDEEKENKIPIKKSPNENLKQWPVNVHDRPEYNTLTKKIETFDYTIREIQKKATKKPRIETVPIRRKSKKKYFTKKRKPRLVEVKKIPIEELKTLVNATTALLRDFFISTKESRALTNADIRKSEICNPENHFEVLRNQTLLFSVVNGLDQSEVEKKLHALNFTEDETKE
ncbi:hypothetical protein NQ314_005547 [Rhamnusium bicolor]|uniref:Uncharacterized protein n=1 Tax=Rhamnusium bicolor TaxID=1586634 RepID=A0AAV8ZIX1_9CUCU|nr:hypothetical protein NQ314_005547 [Rhamnusium bicolor]